MWIVVGVVALVVAVATYVTWVAGRVDRLHARAAAAFAAVDAHSVRRAAAAVAAAHAGTHAGLAAAAQAVLDAHPDDRTLAENDLTRVLRGALVGVDGAGSGALVDVSRRLALARQVHDDLVRDALAVRRRRLVRLLRLGRRHPQPRFFDIDDPTLDPRPS
jgi:hypothetical protein